jgi:transposase
VERKPYPSDLTDAQWEIIREAILPARGGRTGAPHEHPLREIWNAIFYQGKNGCTWRALPHDLPPWSAVWQQ